MVKLLKITIALLFLSFQLGESYAGSGTANVTAGTGDYVYSTITDAGGHFVGRFGLCDGTAAASCATVTAGVLSVAGAVTNAGTFAVQAAQSGTWNITNISGTISLPTGAATSALQTTINTTLGSPFQAGGSIGNTSFAATQATASSLNATVVGTGTFAVQAAQSGTWNITNISGTVSLPTGAATSANQTNASAKTQIVDGSGNVIASTSNNLNVQCANCSGSGASAADAATFTAGTSTFAPAGGQFTSGGATACVTGHQCLVGITAARAFLEDLSSIAGTATLTGNGTTGAGSLRVTIASDNTAFTVNAAQSGTWNITNISGTVSLPTGAATSANQTNASAKTQIVDGSGNVIASTSNNLNVQCANCSGSGVSTADAATFTAGTSLFAGSGGQFTSGGATACVTGHQCMVGMTAARAFFTDISSINGTATLTGNGTAGAGAQRVTIASDNTAFAVNATLQASSATAIGTVNPTTAANWGIGTSTQNSTTVANGQLALAQFNTTPTTITSGNMSPLQLDNAGNLRVVGTGIGDATAVGTNTGSAVLGLVTTSATTGLTNNDLYFLSLTTSRALRSDNYSWGGTALGAPSNYGTSPGAVAVPGVNAFVTNSLTVAAAATGGSSTAGTVVPNNTTAVVLKGSAGTLYGIQAYGLGAAPAYIKIYNATSATCGSGTPVKRIMIPSNPTAALGAGTNITFGTAGLAFSTGITYCITTGIGDADATAPAANTYLMNADFT